MYCALPRRYNPVECEQCESPNLTAQSSGQPIVIWRVVCTPCFVWAEYIDPVSLDGAKLGSANRDVRCGLHST